MKIDFKGLLEGMRNSLFPPAEIKEKIEETAAARIAICKECPNYSPTAISNGYKTSRPDIFCTDCGCNLEFKTKCLHCACPIEKWGALLEETEEQELIKKLNDEKKNSNS